MREFLLIVAEFVAIAACIILGLYCMHSINGGLGEFVGTTIITLPIWAAFVVPSFLTKK